MHRIDADDDDGLFKTSPAPATIVTPEWANDLQENVARLIEAFGITLVKGDFDQLVDAFATMGIPGPVTEVGSNAYGRFRIHPDGQIEQHGHYAGGSANPTITFPMEFPTACENLSVTAVSTSNSTPSGSQGGVNYASPAAGPTTTTFSVWCSADDGSPDTNQPSTTVPFYWRAIGR